ncbi:MAG: 50S ribosomal protein L11 methyltransferase [Gammaproteobacteria bacterium]|nr:50S ribosomal protein L11 methyltransferase [Gammaproteobacteria bacterium]MCF6364038.1 50S ribosomal protein L11 methyltransferase [Gammaproteobacteria bacterium]
MSWLQLTLEGSPEDAERIADALSGLGAVAVTLQDGADQPLYEPPPGETPLWSATRIIGLFLANADIRAITTQLAAKLQMDKLPPWRVSPLEDKDWEREWMDNFHPMRFGKRLWIVPSWHTAPDSDAINILLDPGLAFGTGTHPTTALCLQWLDEHGADHPEVIDYGCGSGILAVAALKLGAGHVWAVDNDPQALIASRDNAAKNQVTERIDTIAPGRLPQQPPVRLLLANILAQPLLELAEKFSRLVEPGGYIVLSGILQHQAEDITRHYAAWFDMTPAAQQEEWVRLSGKRKH